jgi:hypothetical protein
MMVNVFGLKLSTVDIEAMLQFSQILMLIKFNLNFHHMVMMQLSLVYNLFILCEY